MNPLELAEEMQRYGVTTMNRWATDGATLIRSQHAEIEGWKKDQKENLRNQCDLHAEIERLKTVPMKYRRMTFNAELQNEVTALHAERERLKNDDNHICGHMIAVDALRAENQKLRDALESIALAGMSGSGQESEEGIRNWHARRAWEFIGIAARALGETK